MVGAAAESSNLHLRTLSVSRNSKGQGFNQIQNKSSSPSFPVLWLLHLWGCMLGDPFTWLQASWLLTTYHSLLFTKVSLAHYLNPIWYSLSSRPLMEVCYFIYLFICMCIGQKTTCRSPLSPSTYGSLGLNWGCQTWWEVCLSTKPSYQVLMLLSLFFGPSETVSPYIP